MLLLLLFVMTESCPMYYSDGDNGRVLRTGVCDHFTVADLKKGLVFDWRFGTQLTDDPSRVELAGARMACRTNDRFINDVRRTYFDQGAHVCDGAVAGSTRCAAFVSENYPDYGTCVGAESGNVCKAVYVGRMGCRGDSPGANADCRWETRAHSFNATCQDGRCVRIFSHPGC